MTRAQILAQLRRENPTSEIDGLTYAPGDAPYDARLQQWADALAAQLAAAPPASRKIWPTAQEFLQEFTLPEMAAVSLSTAPTVAALRLLLACWRSEVWSDDERIAQGMAAMVADGILTAERAAAILAQED